MWPTESSFRQYMTHWYILRNYWETVR